MKAPAPARRSQRAALPAVPEHPVALTGLAGSGPQFVERRESDFMAALYADLADPARRAALPGLAPRRDGKLRLFHPSQRVQTVALLDVTCAVPGSPPLDPAKIEAAGLVVRRLGPDGVQAWIRTGPKSFGWDEIDEDADPAADKRPPAVRTGHPALEARIGANRLVAYAGARRARGAAPGEPVTEDFTRLFPAPGAVRTAAGKTVLVGVVPVTSSEIAESAPEPVSYGATAEGRADIAGHLVIQFKAGGDRALPCAGRLLDPLWQQWSADPSRSPDAADFAGLAPFLTFLNQLRTELGAFEGTPQGGALLSELGTVGVAFVTSAGTTFRSAAGFVQAASAIILDGEQNSGGLVMPDWIVGFDAATENRLLDAAIACLDARYQALRPAGGRFDDLDARYVARAFVRLKPHTPGCPPRLAWSDYTEPFTLAPWYESAGQPPITIPMPDLFDRNLLRSLKPGVSFAMPGKLAGLLSNDAKDLRDGKGSDKGWTLGWLCSFSIPIITLCAFIVLNIFLQLFAMIFFWLPFLKICLPIPRRKR